MSVYELIRLLEKHPPDLRVVVNGYERVTTILRLALSLYVK